MRKKILILLLLPFLCSACTVGRIIRHNIPGLNDHKHFPTHKAPKSAQMYQFSRSEKDLAPDSIFTRPNKGKTFEQFLRRTNTVAFLIIRRDTILYENYLKGYSETSLVPSYSMAKSVTSILIGCAIAEGLIGSIDEPIRQYLPEMRAKDFDGVTIKDVLQMTTGLKFNEGYANPFGSVARLYYGTNMRKFIRKARRKRKAGDNPNFAYKSGNSQILGAILERAIKRNTPKCRLPIIWQRNCGNRWAWNLTPVGA